MRKVLLIVFMVAIAAGCHKRAKSQSEEGKPPADTAAVVAASSAGVDAEQDKPGESDSIPKPNYFDTLRADFNCDSIEDYAFGFKNDTAYVLQVVLGPATNGAKVSVLRFGFGEEKQAGMCGKEVRLELEGMDYDPTELVGEVQGFEASKTCKGLNVYTVDNECDSFHCFWNHKSQQMDWWRL